MNKKGIDYAALLVVVVLICIGVLYISVLEKKQAVGRSFGKTQLDILNANNDLYYYEIYVRNAAKIALKETIKELQKETKLTKIENCILLNSKEYPKETINIDWLKIIEETFNKNINRYIESFERNKNELGAEGEEWEIPKGEFVIAVNEGKFYGTPLKYTILSKENSRFFFKPGFKIDSLKILEFPKSLKIAKFIAETCSNQKDPVSCAESIANNAKITSIEDEAVKLEIEEAPCYAIYLPSSKDAQN